MANAFDIRPLRSRANTLYVVLGDQLDHEHSLFERIDRVQDAVLMMEVGRESTHPASHVQRTVMFLSAMRHFALLLKERGLRVEYVRLDDEQNTQNIEDELSRAINRLDCKRVVVVRPGDHRVRSEIGAACDREGVRLEVVEDPHFLTTPDEFAEWAKGRKQLTMEYFYREQRRRLGVLVEDGQPVGGQWNYDKENRKAFKRTPRPSTLPEMSVDDMTREVIELVAARLPKLPGRVESFNWPVTRRQALACLDSFIKKRLVRFGTYEDAMWTEQRTLYHSRLAAALNLHLLTPKECIERAVKAYEFGEAPLNSVEGFVRQVISWREFIRGVYFHEGDSYPGRNELGETGQLPSLYWDANTDMVCMRDCVSSVVEEAYAHHIPRLMVMGNFAMLAGVEPRKVSDWYLGMFADGVDWVTAPNVVGMAMHADGGVVGTKPYAASGKYISRMSNYCENCRYSVNERIGENACPINIFYWDFLIRHQKRFAGNHRMAMVLKNVDRLNRDDRTEITISAQKLRTEFGISDPES